MRRDPQMTRRLLLWGAVAPFVCGLLFGRPVNGARYRVTRARKASGARNTKAEDADERDSLIFDLMADERWPIRALDPVLHVGDVAVDSYQYGNPENTLLRF